MNLFWNVCAYSYTGVFDLLRVVLVIQSAPRDSSVHLPHSNLHPYTLLVQEDLATSFDVSCRQEKVCLNE